MTVKEIAQKEPQGLIGRAYKLAEKAHAGQKRKNGEPYFNHVLETAETLNRWALGEPTVAAGLLHDVVEDTPVNLEDVRKNFGEEIAHLVDGVTKIGKIKYHGNEAKAENMRKLIIALGQDLRVIFIKLADRLHNMKTLSALPTIKQKRIALETDEIYATIAYRLGMQNLSGELRDLAFPYIHPQEYKWLIENISERYEERTEYLKKIKPLLEKAFEENGLKSLSIDFRAKRYSSLYQKLLRYNMDIEKIYDLVAMRVIVNSVSECYAALGAIHQIWPPLPGRIKDYIAMPKPNTYRSLHTTVIGPEEKFVEIQIRTRQMHEEDEKGIAAHWLYKEDKTPSLQEIKSQKFWKKLIATRWPYKQEKPDSLPEISPKFLKELRWVEQLRTWQENYQDAGADSEEFLGAMKIDFFKDRIFAITPKGDVVDLPFGATPIDFAYQIHSEIGDTCVGAKVNDNFAPLDRVLHSGDIVQIITQKNKKPSEDWLKFVKTSLARNQIKAALRRKERSLAKKLEPSRAELRLVVQDRVGLLKDISGVISRSHVNILSLHTSDKHSGQFPVDRIECALTDKGKIERLILKLKQIKGVREASYRLI